MKKLLVISLLFSLAQADARLDEQYKQGEQECEAALQQYPQEIQDAIKKKLETFLNNGNERYQETAIKDFYSLIPNKVQQKVFPPHTLIDFGRFFKLQNLRAEQDKLDELALKKWMVAHKSLIINVVKNPTQESWTVLARELINAFKQIVINEEFSPLIKEMGADVYADLAKKECEKNKAAHAKNLSEQKLRDAQEQEDKLYEQRMQILAQVKKNMKRP